MRDFREGIVGPPGALPAHCSSPPLNATYDETAAIGELRWSLDGRRVCTVVNAERLAALYAEVGQPPPTCSF